MIIRRWYFLVMLAVAGCGSPSPTGQPAPPSGSAAENTTPTVTARLSRFPQFGEIVAAMNVEGLPKFEIQTEVEHRGDFATPQQTERLRDNGEEGFYYYGVRYTPESKTIFLRRLRSALTLTEDQQTVDEIIAGVDSEMRPNSGRLGYKHTLRYGVLKARLVEPAAGLEMTAVIEPKAKP